MSPRFVIGGGGRNVPCVAEVVNRSLKVDCTDFTIFIIRLCIVRSMGFGRVLL